MGFSYSSSNLIAVRIHFMNKLLCLILSAVLLLSTTNNLSGDLVIDVRGVIGSGETTWTFSTLSPGIAELTGSIRDNSGNFFSGADTGQFPFGQDTILDTSIQDRVFVLSGDAEVSINGTETESLTGIFLDDDGGSADDLGVRAANNFIFQEGDEITWTGSGTTNVDISTFALGPWKIDDLQGQRMFISETITVNFIAVPEPSSSTLVMLVCASLFVARRRS